MTETLEKTKDHTPSVLKAAWLIAVVTIVSKLIGFIRDIIMANYYGASLVSDAYYYAYQIPSLSLILLGGVGGPFHSATVAIFSKLIPNIKEKPTEEVNRLYSTYMNLTILFFLILSVTLSLAIIPGNSFVMFSISIAYSIMTYFLNEEKRCLFATFIFHIFL